MSVYLNNAATTWPKPQCVADDMMKFLTQGGANLGRGTSSKRDLRTLSVVLDCRTSIAELFGGYENKDPRYVTFCPNVTEALNVVIKGFVRQDMGILASSMEHNAVVRPLRSVEKSHGARINFIDCVKDGTLDPQLLKKTLAEGNYGLMLLSHASNVCGTLQDLESIASVCASFGVPLVLDAAQTAGHMDISVSKLNLAALCFTGHKGLMGPQGVGGIVWRPDFAEAVAPLIEGGTGSYSHVETQPHDMPDKFESGTANLPGIAGLYSALNWLESTGIDKIKSKTHELGGILLNGLKAMKGVTVYGRNDMLNRMPVFSFNLEGADNGRLASALSERGFETRPGLHCAPLAHKTIGSYPEGSLRVSPGYFNTPEDIESFLEALRGVRV